MVATITERRIEKLKQGYRNVMECMAHMDHKMEEITMKVSKTECHFDALDNYMYEIRQYMMKVARGKTEQWCTL